MSIVFLINISSNGTVIVYDHLVLARALLKPQMLNFVLVVLHLSNSETNLPTKVLSNGILSHYFSRLVILLKGFFCPFVFFS